MPSLFETALSPLSYHIISYGALLGFQLYQSFINTRLCFRYLPRAQFTQLQRRVFPVYFQSQVSLILLTAATHPPHSFASLCMDYAGLALLSIALAVGMLNWLVFGPETTQAMIRRAQEEAREDRSHGTPDNKAIEMKALHRSFSRAHTTTIHLNAISVVATVLYGAWLSSRLHV